MYSIWFFSSVPGLWRKCGRGYLICKRPGGDKYQSNFGVQGLRAWRFARIPRLFGCHSFKFIHDFVRPKEVPILQVLFLYSYVPYPGLIPQDTCLFIHRLQVLGALDDSIGVVRPASSPFKSQKRPNGASSRR